jgi:hypothetical protein
MSVLGRLRAESLEIEQRDDPWLAPLQRVRGKIGDDGIERISTQTLFDYLEVRQPNRGAGACRHLASVMRGLGWSSVRVRGLTRGAYLENIRGYCRRP